MIKKIITGEREITLVGTGHVFRESVEEVAHSLR